MRTRALPSCRALVVPEEEISDRSMALERIDERLGIGSWARACRSIRHGGRFIRHGIEDAPDVRGDEARDAKVLGLNERPMVLSCKVLPDKQRFIRQRHRLMRLECEVMRLIDTAAPPIGEAIWLINEVMDLISEVMDLIGGFIPDERDLIVLKSVFIRHEIEDRRDERGSMDDERAIRAHDRAFEAEISTSLPDESVLMADGSALHRG